LYLVFNRGGGGPSVARDLPFEARQFITTFDNDEPGEPFSFELPDFTPEELACLTN
jgi:hypothetical protein